MTKNGRVGIKMAIKKNKVGSYVEFSRFEGSSLEYWNKVKVLLKAFEKVENRIIQDLGLEEDAAKEEMTQ